MKGRKIAILIGTLVSLSMLVLPASVSAVATHTLTATPSTVAWGATEYISLDTGGTNWTGTVYCNVTDPNGVVYYLPTQHLIGDQYTHNYNNWSLMPNVPGAWSVSLGFKKTSGSVASATIGAHTATFTQERTMISVARNINELGPVILYIAIVLVLLVTLMIAVSRVSGERGGKAK